ncbi:hypothetical protein D3C72_691780 [compost metagenome]
MTEALEQQAGQLGREARRRGVVELVVGVIADPGFRGVGEEEADIRVARQCLHLVELAVAAQFAVDAADQALGADGLAGLAQPADDGGVETVLSAQAGGKVAVDGAHDHHAGVEAGVLVEQVQLPVDEGAQEIPLAKLDHAVRILGPREGITIQALHLVVVLMGLCPSG